jgi:hypothetical protein
MPMTKWVGKDELVFFEDGKFGMNFNVDPQDQKILHEMTSQICEYKMQSYFERKKSKGFNK